MFKFKIKDNHTSNSGYIHLVKMLLQFSWSILLFLCLKLSKGSPLLTGQSLTSLGWQTRPFRSWPFFFPAALGPSVLPFREGGGWGWLIAPGFLRCLNLGPCSETQPLPPLWGSLPLSFDLPILLGSSLGTFQGTPLPNSFSFCTVMRTPLCGL